MTLVPLLVTSQGSPFGPTIDLRLGTWLEVNTVVLKKNRAFCKWMFRIITMLKTIYNMAPFYILVAKEKYSYFKIFLRNKGKTPLR